MTQSTLVPAELGDAPSFLSALPAPEPSAGLEAYHRERALCLAASLEKRTNYQRFMVTKMWTVVQKGNYAQVDGLDMVELAAELGFRDQAFAFTLTDWGREAWREHNGAVTVEGGLTEDLARRLMARGAELGVRVSFWQVTSKYETSAPERLCPWPFERAMVTSDQRVTPCCAIGDPDAYEFGKGTGKRFLDVWNSAEYQEFRRAHLAGEIPEICRGCYRLDG